MQKPKILVVDDLKTNILALTMMLRKVDAELLSAQSGNEALSMVLETDIALILLDVNMPQMDGFEVASFLNEDELTKHIPIIFVTAMDRSDANNTKGYDVGAVDFIYKPIDPFILLSKVKVFLDLWTLRHGLEQEIQERKKKEKEIIFLSGHDLLTGLNNRRKFHERLSSEISRAERSGENLALIFLDLDGFKKINDSLGHDAGDYLLKELSLLFKKEIRNSDLLARYGGDEFVVLFTNVRDNNKIIRRVEALIEAAAQMFYYNAHELKVSASVGISLYPEHAITDTELLSSADTAMYLAKAEGKNCFRFYSQSLNDKLKRHLRLDAYLQHALQNDEFELYFQPVIDLQTNSVIGAESLIRWQKNPDLGFVSPEEFIGVAESNGTIHAIGLWVLEETLKLMDDYPELRLAINASSLQFMNNLLYDVLQENIQSGRLNPKYLEIEITERLLLDNLNTPESRLNDISDLGFSMSIDDFGTGYSSLSYLRDCPVSTVKIDKSFVFNIPDHSNEALCNAIIAMAKALNLKVIAEGVETQAQRIFLQYAGCDMCQGYYFAKPLPKEEFIAFLKQGDVS